MSITERKCDTQVLPVSILLVVLVIVLMITLSSHKKNYMKKHYILCFVFFFTFGHNKNVIIYTGKQEKQTLLTKSKKKHPRCHHHRHLHLHCLDYGDGRSSWGWVRCEWGNWRRAPWFRLPVFTALADLSVQHHLLGDAGHLAIGHCVGTVPATQKKPQFKNQQLQGKKKIKGNCLPQILQCSLLIFRAVLHAGLVLFSKEKRSPPVFRVLPWKCCKEQNWTLSDAERGRFSFLKILHIKSGHAEYLDGVEWPLLCTRHCCKSCYSMWTRCALEKTQFGFLFKSYSRRKNL